MNRRTFLKVLGAMSAGIALRPVPVLGETYSTLLPQQMFASADTAPLPLWQLTVDGWQPFKGSQILPSWGRPADDGHSWLVTCCIRVSPSKTMPSLPPFDDVPLRAYSTKFRHSLAGDSYDQR